MDSDRWRDEQRRLRVAARSAQARATGAPTEGHPDEAPLVSVIVACLDEEAVIARCLERLLEQEYERYEVIVVDDGSRDRTAEIAQGLLSSRGGELIVSPNTRGVAHARNTGVARARGDIVAFVDADGYAERDWLRQLTAAFAQDERIGGVASTVFYAANPLVLNGAGGTINRLGRVADLAMNESYEHAELAIEALYAMGCGMAFRRSTIKRVGPFDEAMVNYYDDVDYGIRVWRAGYRLAVASGAWVEHDLAPSGRVSTHRRRLSERHRVRVLLKHTPASEVVSWLRHELAATRQAGGRAARLDAIAWNLAHAAGLFLARRRLRRVPPAPAHLTDPSWGEAFPTGLAPASAPRPEAVGAGFDASDVHARDQLVYGWFATETISGQGYVWAAPHAALLIRLAEPAKQLALRFAHAPVDTGGIDLRVRRLGSGDAADVWSTHLDWQYIERSVENHPLELTSGDYEVLFGASVPWTDPPRETRSLAFALASISFARSYDVPPGGVDMSRPSSEQHLLYGWFEAEGEGERAYRWGTGRAALAVRTEQPVRAMSLCWRLPPSGVSELQVAVRALPSDELVRSARFSGRGGEWREECFDIALDRGSYVVSFTTDGTWSNTGGEDPSGPPERRSLGFALASLQLG